MNIIDGISAIPSQTVLTEHGYASDTGGRTDRQVKDFESIPFFLKARKQWVMWRLEQREGANRPTKIPYQVDGKRKAKTDDSATWFDFSTCQQALASENFTGIGFAFAEGDGLAGIDLDHCYGSDGQLEPWAQEIVSKFGATYVEKSPSGDGLHIWCLGTPVRSGQEKWKQHGTGKEQGIEVYAHPSNRYFTVTGHAIVCSNIVNCQSALDWLYQKYLGQTQEEPKQARNANGQVDVELVRKALEVIPANDYGTWIQIGMALKAGGLDVEIWDMWASKSPKFQQGICTQKWKTFNGNRIGLGTVFHFAKQYGFSFPTGSAHGEQKTSTVSAHLSAPATLWDWPDPKEIRTELSPITPMSREMIPEPIREWVWDTAYRMQCPPEGVAVAAIVAISGVIGAGCAMRPKSKDDWMVIPNLWGALIGRPGVILKSPALKAVMAAVYRLEDAASTAHRQASKGYEADAEVYKARQASIKNDMKATKDEHKLAELRQNYIDLYEPEPIPKRRYVLNDTTVEAANKLLAESPRGLIHFRDELTGWLASLDKEGREGDRAFYLEAYDGNGRKRDDRITRDSVDNANLCLAVLGGIQPDKLERYLFDSMHRMENDGLIQRFQLMVFPDEPLDDTVIDEKPNLRARERAFGVIEKLAGMDFLAAGANDSGNGSRPFFSFNEDAQKFFLDEWLPDHKRKERLESHSMMQEHLVKYRKLMPALSLIFHLISIADRQARGENVNPTGVCKHDAELAAAWCELLEEHARRIYGIVASVTAKATTELAKHIKKGELGERFTARAVHRKQWRFLTDADVVGVACEELVDARWLYEELTDPEWQRKRVCWYVVNPKVKANGKISESIPA